MTMRNGNGHPTRALLVLGVLTSLTATAGAEPFRPLDDETLDRLAAQVGFRAVPVEQPCVPAADGRCLRRALDRAQARLAAPQAALRVLVLGDSHIASDYITSMARHRLQSRFGDGGRGLVQPDQSARYGGRKLFRSSGWEQERIVDAGQAGKTFGLTGLALESRAAGARLLYRLAPEDRYVEVHFEVRPRGPSLLVKTGTVAHRFRAAGPERRVGVWRFELPTPTPDRLEVKALGPGVRVFGVAFETARPGVVLEAMGPVGAESQVYLQMDRASFQQHLQLRDPGLVVLMLGGNDALKVRKGWWTLERVEVQFRQLTAVLRTALPSADCLMITPMAAGVRQNGVVVSRDGIEEVQDVIRRVALDAGCGVWDALEAMGGPDQIRAWVEAGIMNPQDLLHPRRAAADLLGRGWADALVRALSFGPEAPGPGASSALD